VPRALTSCGQGLVSASYLRFRRLCDPYKVSPPLGCWNFLQGADALEETSVIDEDVSVAKCGGHLLVEFFDLLDARNIKAHGQCFHLGINVLEFGFNLKQLWEVTANEDNPLSSGLRESRSDALKRVLKRHSISK
jgi:hypothetical protein